MNKFILAALLAPALFGQSYTSVQATQVKNAFGGTLNSGQLCFISNSPITANGGAAATSFCGAITSGSLSGSLQVPNLATATPMGSSYTIQVVDFASASPTSVLWIPNVYSVTGPTFNLDAFSVPAGVLVTGYDSPRIPCQSGASYIQANAPNGSNRWSCTGGTWTQATQGGALPKGIFSLNGVTATSQVFQNDINIGINSVTGAHALTWTGTLGKSRQHPATSYLDGTNIFTGDTLDASAVSITKPFTVVSGVPAGSCSNSAAFAVNGQAASANLYQCVAGSWQQLVTQQVVSSDGSTPTSCSNCTTSNFVLAPNQLIAGDGTLGIKPVNLIGDVTTNGGNATSLQSVNSNPGTFGDATHALQLTVDPKGRITSLSQVAITGATGTVTNVSGALTLNRLLGGNGGADVKSVDLSGDVSTAGSLATSLAAVNANPGSFGDATHIPQITVDNKGRITSVAQVTSAGGSNGITALTGDVNAAGPGSVAATLATINANTGVYGDSSHIPQLTIDGKGRITAATVIAASGTVGTGGTGTSNHITSGIFASIPGTCATGDVYFVTDPGVGQTQFYNCTGTGAWAPIINLGPSGALAVSSGQLDIVTSVVPRLSAGNSFSGSNTFGGTTTLNNVVINGTCTGSCGTGTGSSFNQTVQVNGTPATQRAKLNLSAGTNTTLTASDNGTDTTTVTISATGGAGSSSWSALTAPSANTSLSMGSNTTNLQWGASTGSSNLFTVTDTANNTGTGFVATLGTASGSSANPFQVLCKGNGCIQTLPNGYTGFGTAPSFPVDVFHATQTSVMRIRSLDTVGTNPIVLQVSSSAANAYFGIAGPNYFPPGGAGAPGSTLVKADNDIVLMSSNTGRWQIHTGGNLLAAADNQYSIGTAGANRPSNVYVAKKVTASTYAAAVNAVSSSATPTFDLSLGDVQTMTVNANVTTVTLSNLTAGQRVIFDLVHDATSTAYTFAWPTSVKGTPITIGSTASKHNIQAFFSPDGINLYPAAPGMINQ